MGSLSKSIAHDAGKRLNPEKPRTVVYAGERRSEKWVSGVSDRFVDLQGNVTDIQLVPPGAPSKHAAVVEAKRQQLHKQRNADGTVVGFVEHGRCPVRHGLLAQIPALAAEFEEAGINLSPCAGDPKTFTVDARGIRTYANGCAHVEALIKSRRAVAAERAAARSSRQESLVDIERKKLAEQQATNAHMAKLLEKVADKLDQPTPTPRVTK